ncbi:hypothetical protein ZWY2020_009985 [Hordeum vulgare]|nr:hypothetical protein ZWY2020_009985 [Hordeum vulgare]
MIAAHAGTEFGAVAGPPPTRRHPAWDGKLTSPPRRRISRNATLLVLLPLPLPLSASPSAPSMHLLAAYSVPCRAVSGCDGDASVPWLLKSGAAIGVGSLVPAAAPRGGTRRLLCSAVPPTVTATDKDGFPVAG